VRRFVSVILLGSAFAFGTVSASSGQTTSPSSPPSTVPPGGPVAAPPAPATTVSPSTARIASSSDPVLRDSPVGYWLLDDVTGLVAQDSVVAPRVRHDGSYTAATTHSVSGPGSGLTGSRQFPGTPCDGVGIDPGIAQFTGEFSVEGWVNTVATSGVIFRWRWYGYLLRVSNSRASFEVSASGSGGGFVAGTVLNGTRPIADGQWHHVAGVRSATKLQLFVDGSLDAEIVIGSPSNFYGLPKEAAIGRDGDACNNAISVDEWPHRSGCVV
jgi:hypothetical protein